MGKIIVVKSIVSGIIDFVLEEVAGMVFIWHCKPKCELEKAVDRLATTDDILKNRLCVLVPPLVLENAVMVRV